MHGFAVLIVAQAFKGSLSVRQVGEAVRRGAARAGADARVLLASDGGDGLLDAISDSLVRRTHHRTTGPLGEGVEAPVGWLDRQTAVVESRLVCGLSLLTEDRRNPLRTTTRGLGTLVQDVAAAGAGRVVIGLGGSATMDGGLGMARSWGWRATDAAGRELPEGGGSLIHLESLEPGRQPSAQLVALCDVRNPLNGARGARVYAAQKGAGPEAIERLARGLERLAAVSDGIGPAGLAEHAGAGAAGGLGFGILFFGGGTLVEGASWVLDRLEFAGLLREKVDLVVVAEAAFDETSLEGKLTGEVLRKAVGAGVPVHLIAPSARAVPRHVTFATGPGVWTARDLEEHAATSIAARLRLLPG